MIKYNLKCNNNHEFESWFSDSLEFDKLKKRKLLECIYCSSKKIKKIYYGTDDLWKYKKKFSLRKFNKKNLKIEKIGCLK